MKWSLKIARVAGIDVFVHATFLILVGWLLLGDLLNGRGLAVAGESLATLIVLFSIIVLHELGHATMARRFGIRTASITLLPIGGVASMEEIPRDPYQELLVALAGPAVNLALAAVGVLVLALTGHISGLGHFSELLPRFVLVNVTLAVFNMIPAFPMDGGRVLRALLSLNVDRVRATNIAAVTGQALALLLGLIGFFVNPMLMFVALFVWIGAESEAQSVREEDTLAGLTVGDVMAREFYVSHPQDSLGSIADKLGSGFQTDVPVMEKGHLVGMLGLEDLARGLSNSGRSGLVGDHMGRADCLSTSEQDLAGLMRSWRPSNIGALAVIQGGELIGLVTPALVAEHVLLKSSQRPTFARPVRQRGPERRRPRLGQPSHENGTGQNVL